MHFCVGSISAWWFIWRLFYIRNVLLFPTHLMCTRHLISERLSTYSWFQPGSVKCILLCKCSCIPLIRLLRPSITDDYTIPPRAQCKRVGFWLGLIMYWGTCNDIQDGARNHECKDLGERERDNVIELTPRFDFNSCPAEFTEIANRSQSCDGQKSRSIESQTRWQFHEKWDRKIWGK